MSNLAQLIHALTPNTTALATIPVNTSSTAALTANFSSLLAVKACANAGTTKTIASLSLNLSADQTNLTGVTAIAQGNPQDPGNSGISGSQIIVPTSTDPLTRGDAITFSVDNQRDLKLTYGGFTEGRSITNGTGGDSGTSVSANSPFAGNILDATNPSQSFLGITGTSSFSSNDLTFTLSSPATGTYIFTYTPIAPNAQLGQFSNLSNLADAISSTDLDNFGLTARVENGRLYVGSVNANDSVTIANGGSGIDWKNQLGLANIPAGTNRFSSLQNLSLEVNTSSDLKATVNPFSASSVSISTATALETLKIKDASANTGSLVSALGLSDSLAAGNVAPQSTGLLKQAYSPTVPGKNMASGGITADFSRPFDVKDSLGKYQTVMTSFVKISDNNWAVEIYPLDSSDASTTTTPVTYGTVTFNANGTIKTLSTSLQQPSKIKWPDGTTTSLTMNLNSLTQNNALYNVASVDVRNVG